MKDKIKEYFRTLKFKRKLPKESSSARTMEVNATRSHRRRANTPREGIATSIVFAIRVALELRRRFYQGAN